MKLKISIPLVLSLVVCSCTTTRNNKEEKIATQRPSVKCMENSPERHGEEGCTILTDRPLVGSLTKTVYWHIDRFESLEAAIKAAGPNSVAVEAHGFFWLLKVEARAEDHHAGQHVAHLGPLDLAPADSYKMRVLSSLLEPGSTTPIHTHSGPEVFYVVDGEQCIEMSEAGKHLVPGQSYVVPGRSVHRGRVIGSKARRALALILYDAGHPASHDLDPATPIVSCK
jgi:quercetin dioxygenase-like cupin family protein